MVHNYLTVITGILTLLMQMKQLERQKEALENENQALKQRERYVFPEFLPFINLLIC